jgi:hypothetical protein
MGILEIQTKESDDDDGDDDVGGTLLNSSVLRLRIQTAHSTDLLRQIYSRNVIMFILRLDCARGLQDAQEFAPRLCTAHSVHNTHNTHCAYAFKVSTSPRTFRVRITLISILNSQYADMRKNAQPSCIHKRTGNASSEYAFRTEYKHCELRFQGTDSTYALRYLYLECALQ